MANTKITSNVISDDIALGGNPTTTTQSAGNDTTRIATTAFVKAAIDATIDSAPGALDTLNELAAAIGDDANFSTTITNSIAAKLPLAGGTMTGNIVMGDDTSIGIADDAERIEFDGAGDINILGANLGIGTTSPASLLHVDEGSADDCRIIAETHAGGDSMILFSQGASGSGTPTWGLGLDAGSGTSDGFSIGFEDTGYDDFSLTSDSKLVITTAGNVGIGETDPDRHLHLTGSGANTGRIKLENTSASYYAGLVMTASAKEFHVGVGGASTAAGYANNLYIHDATAGALRATIDTNGKVGIGGSPDTLLNLKDTGGIEVRLEADSNNNGQEDCFIRFYTDGKTQEGIAGMDNNNSSTLFSGNTENAMVFGTVSNLPVVLATNNTERFQISAAGAVTAPNQPTAIYTHSGATEDGAYGYNYGVTSGAASVYCRPQTAVVNRGSMYNASNGRFTAPVAGVYRYAVHGNLYTVGITSTAYWTVRIWKNTSHYIYHYEANQTRAAGSWVYANVGGIIEMAANDYIRFQLLTNAKGGQNNHFGWDLANYTHYEFQLLY